MIEVPRISSLLEQLWLLYSYFGSKLTVVCWQKGASEIMTTGSEPY